VLARVMGQCIFLRVDDVDATYTAFVNAGVRLITGPRTEPYGRLAVFLDIAGNRWDLLGPAPVPCEHIPVINSGAGGHSGARRAWRDRICGRLRGRSLRWSVFDSGLHIQLGSLGSPV
jgi:hypothetical protein